MAKCRQCQADFELTQEDLDFLDKLSPNIGQEKFELPVPTLCPRCRSRRRLGVRNVINLYKRKCDLCGKETVSMYSPDKSEMKVFCHDCWWSDKWSHSDFSQEYDPNRSFIEQITELKNRVPAPALMHSGDENSDYINLANDNKDCYLIFLSGRNEDVYYSFWAEDSKSCVDISYSAFCELCYESVLLGNCYNVNWSINCGNCRDSYFIEDSADCKDCILCSGLLKKQYCYKNEQLSKEEYEKVKSEFLTNLDTKLEEYRQEFKKIILSSPKKFAQMLRSENCSGNSIYDSKNCYHCFLTSKSEDCRYCYMVVKAQDSMDVDGFGIPIELVYESQNVGLGTSRSAFVSFAYQLPDSFYCEHCYYSKNLFGCVGAKNHAEYCVLNKQYSKEEYEKLVAQIIEDMKKRGEWGEFFPENFSSFGYNESLADYYYPLTKEEALNLGYKWQEDDFDIEFAGEPYVPLPISEYKESEQKRQELLSGVLKCEASGRPFKILPQELFFHIKNNIPLPRKHFKVRMMERLALINKNDLYHRQCDCAQTSHGHGGRCMVEFESPYSLSQNEKVYCEECYWDKYR